MRAPAGLHPIGLPIKAPLIAVADHHVPRQLQAMTHERPRVSDAKIGKSHLDVPPAPVLLALDARHCES
jgi:hypothetical protein